MFQSSNPGSYKTIGLSAFEVRVAKVEGPSPKQEEQINPFALRQLWIGHLLHEKDTLQKTELKRQPLNSFFRSAVFSSHVRDDRSIH